MFLIKSNLELTAVYPYIYLSIYLSIYLPIFQVVSVRGGVEVLIAAGFQLREEAEAECADKEDGAQVLGTETRARPEVLGTETRAGPEVLGTETRAGPEVLGTETRNIYRHDTGKPMQLYFESPAESMSQHRLRYVLCR
jgi:hypothetical protein